MLPECDRQAPDAEWAVWTWHLDDDVFVFGSGCSLVGGEILRADLLALLPPPEAARLNEHLDAAADGGSINIAFTAAGRRWRLRGQAAPPAAAGSRMVTGIIEATAADDKLGESDAAGAPAERQAAVNSWLAVVNNALTDLVKDAVLTVILTMVLEAAANIFRASGGQFILCGPDGPKVVAAADVAAGVQPEPSLVEQVCQSGSIRFDCGGDGGGVTVGIPVFDTAVNVHGIIVFYDCKLQHGEKSEAIYLMGQLAALVALIMKKVQLQAQLEQAQAKCHQAEAELQQQQRLVATVFESLPGYAFYRDVDGRYLLVNQQFAAALGLRPDEVIGRTIYELHEPARAQRYAAEDKQLIDGELSVWADEELIASGGRKLIVYMQKVPVRDEAGRVTGIIGLAVDITEHKQLEVKLTEALAAAEAANQAKDQFLAAMSHELRTPLNAIMGFSEVLLDQHFGPLNDKQQVYVNDILDSARHLLEIINDVLDLAKLNAGKTNFYPETVDIAKLLRQTLGIIKDRAAAKNIAVELAVDAGVPPQVQVDVRRFKQIMYNLLSNAVKFTPDGGAIKVECRDAGEWLEISVEDTGIGIAATHAEHIFEPFYQVSGNLTAKTPGTGLGLAITRQLVELHGGRIWLERSEPGQGSRFTFVLPVRQDGGECGVIVRER
ncbi:PAS/PAC sensor signal transduction histidine kinase [Thermosinus carboxydivorans Nor1]|uniref:histidine kinase n=1 Tax=Thermosinus carboxydivorans Nor1 TaxID=401526 RepID=A1HSJ7_9FIRM|nr:PAS domain-containing sensor histidine kinase [Thermosinus carboxydivorans]EAX46969.1 PAS/PAC sensor signal transduction histidine kinase [Thermosinus carboxydivorans Nor1]